MEGFAGRIPSPATCWRRRNEWENKGIWLKAWRAMLTALDEQGTLNWDEVFAYGSFAPAKKGPLRGKNQK